MFEITLFTREISWEVLNIFIGAFVVLKMFRSDVPRIYFWLSIYCALHFAFSVIPVLAGDPIEIIRNQRLHEGVSFVTQTVTVFVILAAVSFTLFKKKGIHKGLVFALALLFGVLTFGYLMNIGVSGQFQFRNVAMVGLMLLLMALPAAVQVKLNQAFSFKELIIIIILLVAMLIVAFIEIYYSRAWAIFYDSTGEVVMRSSAFLFNPNLYAMWSALVVIMFSLLYSAKKIPGWIALITLCIAFFGIYLSGSRSIAFILLLTLIIAGLISRDKPILIRFIPVLLMLAVFLGIWLLSYCVSNILPDIVGWKALVTLGERFIVHPIHFFAYIFNQVNFLYKLPLPSEIIVSIEGRFMGDLKDAAWLVLYDDTGWFGVISVAGVWIALGLLAIRTYMLEPNHYSIFALSVWVFSIGIGCVMRYQVFPTGVFVSIGLSPCLLYWFSVNKKGRIDEV